jgi:ankyrin repeat protein
VLLKHKADANVVDADGNSPLHYLGENASCSAAMVAVLLAAKADPNSQNQVRFITVLVMRRRKPVLTRQ